MAKKIEKKNIRPTFEEACRKYVHRYTMDHVPQWAKSPCTDEKTGAVVFYYAPQFRSDREWYDNTLFPGEDGHYNGNRHCQTANESWPLGQRLDTPYVKGQQR